MENKYSFKRLIIEY